MNKTNISEIESFLYSLFKGKVSNNVFVSTFPTVINKQWKEMCLIDCSTIHDLDAYGQGVALVYIFVKPHSDGTKDTAAMYALEKKLDKVLQDYTCDKFYLSRRSTDSDFDTTLKWHLNVVEIKVTIL